MRRIFILCLSIFLICGVFIGCSIVSSKMSTASIEKNKSILQENIDLKEQLLAAEEKIQIIQEEHDSEIELRNILDLSFHSLMEQLENGNINDMKKLVTNNISIYNNKLVNNDSQKEFTLPKGKYYFRQKFFNLTNSNSISKFNVAYELHGTEAETLPVCYVDFILLNGEWKINMIGLDIN